MISQNPDPKASLVAAVHSLAGSETVRRFAITFDTALIDQELGLWSVPVASGITNGNARDLMNAITSIQEQLEKSTTLPVMVVLDPGLD